MYLQPWKLFVHYEKQVCYNNANTHLPAKRFYKSEVLQMTLDPSLLKGNRIVFLGDSITLGYSLTDYNDRFATRICKKFGALEVNHGITGTLVAKAGMNRADGNSYIDRLSLLQEGDYIVIFGGTNDYFWSDRPIHPPEGEYGNDYFSCAVNEILQYCCSIGAQARTLIVTPYPHNGIGNYQGGATYNTSCRHDTCDANFNGHTLSDYVAVLNTACQQAGIACIDLHEVQGFDWTVHTTEGCHPNPDGHQWLADQIGEALLAVANNA